MVKTGNLCLKKKCFHSQQAEPEDNSQFCWPSKMTQFFSLMSVLSQSNHADVTIWWFQHSIYPIMQTNLFGH